MSGIMWKLNAFLRSPVASSRLTTTVNKTLSDVVFHQIQNVGIPQIRSCH